MNPNFKKIFFGELECFGHSFAYVAHLYIFLRYVWIRNQRQAAVASRRATTYCISAYLRNFVIPTFCMRTFQLSNYVDLFFNTQYPYRIRSIRVSIYYEANAKVCNPRFWRLSRRSSSIPSHSSALPAPAG
jgi:hypothetical protein